MATKNRNRKSKESARGDRVLPRLSSKRPPMKPDADELENAAQERGERIETGKAIARGGKTKGHVPGTM